MSAAWRQAALARLVIPSHGQRAAASERAQGSLATLQRQLPELPNGVSLAEQMKLAELRQALDASDPHALRNADRFLQGSFPAAIRSSVKTLGRDVSILAGYCELDADRIENARCDATQLAEFWRSGGATTAELDLRSAYANLASTRLVDDLLPAVREHISYPNAQVLVTRDYIHSVASRRFTVPVSFTHSVNQGSVAVNGSIAFRIEPQLIDNQAAAQLRLLVSAAGSAQINGRRDQITARAAGNLSAVAAQSVLLDDDGVHARPVALQVTTATSLQSVNVGLRCPAANRIASRMAGRVATSKLAAANPQIAAGIRQQTSQTVDDECADMSYRINGLLRIAIAEPLLARSLEPETRLRTDRQGVWSTASVRHHLELAATTPPPALPPEIAARNEIAFWLHESALNNVADDLAGVRLDETTFFEILHEQLKLGSDAIDRLPKPRIAAAIVFADYEPLRVWFTDQNLNLVVRVQACEAEGTEVYRGTAEIRASYRVNQTADGIQLQRKEPLSTLATPPLDGQAAEIVERFLPAEAHSLPHYRNASFTHYMRLRYLDLSGGWLVTSARREPVTPAPEASVAMRRAKP